MTWNRDKKSWRGETVKLRILLHVRFGGGSFKNDLESWQEVLERRDCEVENTFACKVLGGEVLKMTSYRDKKSWGGVTVKLRLLLHVKV